MFLLQCDHRNPPSCTQKSSCIHGLLWDLASHITGMKVLTWLRVTWPKRSKQQVNGDSTRTMLSSHKQQQNWARWTAVTFWPWTQHPAPPSQSPCQQWQQVALAFTLKATATILNFQTCVRKEAVEWPGDHLPVFLEAELSWQPATGKEPASALVTGRFGLDPWRKMYCCWKSKPVYERPKKLWMDNYSYTL